MTNIPTIPDRDSLRSAFKAKGRRRRRQAGGLAAAQSTQPNRNDLVPKLRLVDRAPSDLTYPARNVREIDQAHLAEVVRAISRHGFCDPPLIDQENKVLDGVIRVEAAKTLGLPTIPCIQADHLTPAEKRAVRLALNRLSEKGSWDLDDLKIELSELIVDGIDIADTGFSLLEIDQIFLEDEVSATEQGPLAPEPNAHAVARLGDLFILGDHRIICGDATDPSLYQRLMSDEQVRLVLADQPYNVPIAGNVTTGDRREFVMASGEMTEQEFAAFNVSWIKAAMDQLCDGGFLATFIDWRGYPSVHSAALSAGLRLWNHVVWIKTNAGLGSLYRSQHEFLPLYKKGSAPHINNVNLGKNGRWRSNVWTYPGASSPGSEARKGLQYHPTVKPVAMLEDAILDVTERGDIVLDPFLGSGSTLIAAEKAGRRCRGIELDPLYVDVIIRRFEKATGKSAILESSGEAYFDLAECGQRGATASK